MTGRAGRHVRGVGFNNNQFFVIPEWQMVAVRLVTDGNVSDEVWDGFFGDLAASIGREARDGATTP